MQNMVKIVLASLALLFSHNIVAEWYVGTETIESHAIPHLDSLAKNSSAEGMNDGHDSFSLIGGYRTNEFFSVQLKYQDEILFGVENIFSGSSLWFPKVELTNFKSNAFFLTGISSYPVNDNTALYMKGGVFNWEINSKLYNSNNDASERIHGTDIFYGFGANYDLNARFKISAEWERYQMQESDIDYLSTELKFKF